MVECYLLQKIGQNHMVWCYILGHTNATQSSISAIAFSISATLYSISATHAYSAAGFMHSILRIKKSSVNYFL